MAIIRRSSMIKHDLFLPWTVVQNHHGKIAIVDRCNNGKDVTSGRVCNLPQGKDGRGLHIAKMICDAMNYAYRREESR